MEMSTEATPQPPRMSAARLARREAARHAPLSYRRVHPEALGNALRLHLIVHSAAAFGLTWYQHVPFLSPLTAEQIAMQAYCWLMSSIVLLYALGMITGSATVAVSRFSLARLLPIPHHEFLRSGLIDDMRVVLRQLSLTCAISIVMCFGTSHFTSVQFWDETTGLILRLWPWDVGTALISLPLVYLVGVIIGDAAGPASDSAWGFMFMIMTFCTTFAFWPDAMAHPRFMIAAIILALAAVYSWTILRPRDRRGRP